MVKQGGSSINHNQPSKRQGSRPTYRCSTCGRVYSMDWCRERHEKQCKEYNEAKHT